MKILFVTPRIPINNRSGAAHRSYQLLEELKKVADVDTCTCSDTKIPDDLEKRFSQENTYLGNIQLSSDMPWYFAESKPQPPMMTHILQKTNYDYVVIRYYASAYKLGMLKHPKLILDCDDCYIELYNNIIEHAPQFLTRLFHRLRLKVLYPHYERNLKQVPHVIYAKVSSRFPWLDNFHLLQNRLPKIAKPVKLKRTDNVFRVLFVGLYDYLPNVWGLDDFIINVWPRVIEQIPDAELKVVGRGLPCTIAERWQQIKGISILGYVENISNVYSNVDVSVAPILIGSGTHIKVMESLLRGKTMVISPFAHRGYEETLKDGESLLVARNAEDYAEKLCLLAKDVELRERLEDNGYQAALEHHVVSPTAPAFFSVLLENKPLEESNEKEQASKIV